MMIDVYKDGTGVSAAPTGYTIAGKTGSTQSTDDINQNGTAEDDHWFIGYTPDVVVATWMGYDSDKYNLGEYGANEGSGLFKAEMQGIIPTTNETAFGVQAASTLANESSNPGSSASGLWDNIKENGQNIGNTIKQKASQWKQQIENFINNH